MTLWLLLSAALAQDAPPPCDLGTMEDSLHLVTVSSRPTVDQVFGHTGILFYDRGAGDRSKMYDFGHFDGRDPVALVRDVVFATQRYYLAQVSLDRTVKRARRAGREVVLQELRTTPDQRAQLRGRLDQLLERAPYFDYNWYGPNCTTKARDVLDEMFEFQLSPQNRGPSGTSPARQVLRHSASMWPLWFGLHWGSGRLADQQISHWDSMFLPETLMKRFGEATIATDAGPKSVVLSQCRLTNNAYSPTRAEAPNRDVWLWLLGVVLALGVYGSAKKRPGLTTVLYGLSVGIFGCVALFVGIVGTFAPFWGHHNLYFASPIHLALIPAAWFSAKNGGARVAEQVALGLLGVVVLGVVSACVFGLADRNLGLWGLCGLPMGALWYALRTQAGAPSDP